jgi:hypothetical protein
MNSLFHKIALCTVLVIVSILLATTGLVSAADTYSITVTTDNNNYAVNTEVTISGLLTNSNTSTPTSGVLVAIKVTDPIGDTAFQTIAQTRTNGTYSTSFIHQAGDLQPTGTYTVMANAAIDGNQIAMKTTTFNVATSVPEFSSTVFITIALFGVFAATALAIVSVKGTPKKENNALFSNSAN